MSEEKIKDRFTIIEKPSEKCSLCWCQWYVIWDDKEEEEELDVPYSGCGNEHCENFLDLAPFYDEE